MVKLVTKIARSVAGRTIQPGEEFDVDEKIANVLLASGQAEEPSAKKDAAAQAPDAAKTDAAKADASKQAAPAAAKATEVKPMTLADGPNQGEYATRDLKAKG